MRMHALSTILLWSRRGLALAMIGLITWLSLTDSSGLRHHELMHWLVCIERATGAAQDKIVHFFMYVTLSGALWLSLPWRVRRLPSPLIAFLAAATWGVLMEFAQLAETLLGWGSRSFDVGDMVANALGAATTTLPLLLLWFAVERFRARNKRPAPRASLSEAEASSQSPDK